MLKLIRGTDVLNPEEPWCWPSDGRVVSDSGASGDSGAMQSLGLGKVLLLSTLKSVGWAREQLRHLGLFFARTK